MQLLQAPRVVYLDEMELKSSESRKCIARICPQCHTPSIWAQVQPKRKTEPLVVTLKERVPPRLETAAR